MKSIGIDIGKQKCFFCIMDEKGRILQESLSDFQTWLEDEKGKKFNQAVQISYYTIRGFYSHNDINTQKIRTPKVEPSKILNACISFVHHG